MNKKAHHEIGLTPYALIASIVIFLTFQAKKLNKKFKKSD